MIPKDHITHWRAHAPWSMDAQVEQDLVISRALVEMSQVAELANSLAFRGGTALYKLYFVPPVRYSEDIDLVQIRPEPIGKTLDRTRAALDPWLGAPRRQFKEGQVNLVYRFESEDVPPLKMRLKLEVKHARALHPARPGERAVRGRQPVVSRDRRRPHVRDRRAVGNKAQSSLPA